MPGQQEQGIMVTKHGRLGGVCVWKSEGTTSSNFRQYLFSDLFFSPDQVCAHHLAETSPTAFYSPGQTDLFKYPSRSTVATNQVLRKKGVAHHAFPLFHDGDGGFA